ncbi:MAG TPA: hypothetical protein VFA12_20195 [Stellaceae bacterium]|nr:hypothetical protein [Stellaceae bacterium]
MAQLGGINQVNTGRDVSFNIVTDAGLLSLDITQSFRRRGLYDHRVSRPINGPPKFVPIIAGWELDFELDRQNAGVDTFFANLESTYYQGGAINAGTITETIIDADTGAVHVFLFSGLMLTCEDIGDVKADDMIKMRVQGRASTRTQLS